MEKLIKLLLNLIERVPFLSENDKADALDTLRGAESDLGVAGVVPPPPADANTAPVTPEVAVPGPVADPVPPEEQPPPPVSPEVAGTAPEDANAFVGTDPNAPPAPV